MVTGRARRILQIAAIGMTSVLATLLLLEFVVLRKLLGLYPDYSVNLLRHDPDIGWAFAPGSQGLHSEIDFAIMLRINSHGMRDVEHSYAKPPGVFRVLVLGDSFTEGYGVELEQSYPRLMEAILRDRMKRTVEVINAGMRGTCTDQHYLLWRKKGMLYQPDLVLLSFVRGDENNTPKTGEGYFKPYFVLDQGSISVRGLPIPVKDTSRPPSLFRRVTRYFALTALAQVALAKLPFRKTVKRQDEHKSPMDSRISGDRLPSFGPEAWPIVRGILHEMNKSVTQAGGQFAVAHCIGDATYGARLAEATRSGEIPYFDLANSPQYRAYASEKDLFFRFDSHWNANGHQRVAELLSDFLLRVIQERGLLETKPSGKARVAARATKP